MSYVPNNTHFNSFIHNRLYVLHHCDYGSGFNPISNPDFNSCKALIRQKSSLNTDIPDFQESFFEVYDDDQCNCNHDSYLSDDLYSQNDDSFDIEWNPGSVAASNNYYGNDYLYEFDDVEWKECAFSSDNNHQGFELSNFEDSTFHVDEAENCICEKFCSYSDDDEGNKKKNEYTNTPVMKGKKLVVININFRVKQYELWNFFSKFGPVKYCEILLNANKYSRGIGYVVFRSRETSTKALNAESNELVLKGREMKLFYATLRKNDDEISSCDSSVPIILDTDNNDLNPDVKEDNLPMNYLSILDDYSLIQIFSYLDVYEHIVYQRVCHRWKDILLKSLSSFKLFNLSILFRHIPRYKQFNDRQFQSMFKQFTKSDGFSNLTYISLAAASKLLSDKTIIDIGKRCSSLKSIDISGMDITDKGLRNFAQHCPNLIKIVMKRCYKIKDDGVWYLFQKCKQLTYIDLEDNKRIKGKSFHVIGHDIKTIIIRGCNNFQNIGLLKIAKQCPDLEEIDISNCFNLNDINSLNVLAQNCAHLKSLIYEGFNYASPSSENLMMALTFLKNIEILKFQKNFIINDLVLRTIGANCKYLKTIDICGILSNSISDAGIISLSQCKFLEILNISYLDKITDEAIEVIASNGSLRQLIARGCDSLEHTSFIAVAEKCPNIILIDMIGCIFVSSHTIEEIILVREKYSNLKNILTIIIGDSQLKKADMIIPAYVEIQTFDFGHYFCDQYNLENYESDYIINDVFYDNDMSFSGEEYADLLDDEWYDENNWYHGIEWS